jgi:hypothetical protein
MAVEATILISLFNQLREWLNRSDTRSAREDTDMRAALKSVYVAAFETKAYLAAIEERGEAQNHETETKLSRLWADAAVDLRHIDQDLADRCLLKGDYWSNPNIWTQEQVDESRINVDKVYADARELLFA